jgi:hypothetical protein
VAGFEFRRRKTLLALTGANEQKGKKQEKNSRGQMAMRDAR